MSYHIRNHIGQRVHVRHCRGAYQLPDGLPERAIVTLVDFDRGYWTVRYGGKLFEVAVPCVGNAGVLPNPFHRAR